MARVAALVPDLLFGSQVQGALAAAGHDVQLVASEDALRGLLAECADASPAVLVVDLTDSELKGAEIVESLMRAGTLRGTRTLAFYAHVDVDVRLRAERAGFDLVVPRSRMAREGAELVRRLAQDSQAS